MTRKLLRKIVRLAFGEIGAVLAVGAIAFGALVFMLIADETIEGDTHGFDQSILLALREPGDTADPIGPPWLEAAIGDITALGGYAFLGLLITGAVIYLLSAAKFGAAMLVGGSVISGSLMVSLLKMGFDRPRPDLVAHLAHAQSSSFPSGHASVSAIAFLTLGVMFARAHEHPRTKILVMAYAIILTLLVGMSRVYLGVHWPTDVLAGWTFGAAWAALWWLFAWWLQREGRIEQP